MTPHEIIYNVLLSDLDMHHADQLANDILERLAAQGFVAVHASAVIKEDGKVAVSRKLVESVLADAETWVIGHYFADGKVIAALQSKYERDMCDIRLLRAELGETDGE